MNDKKKKVAVFLNGWNNENTCRFLTGLQEHSEESSADYYVFVSHAIYSYTEIEIKSMCTIFDLPDLSGFDAAILFTPGLNFTDVINQLIIKLERSGIPVISIGLRHPGFYYVGINNYTGMRQLCDHLIEMHNVRDITFIAGSRENEDSNTRLQALTDSAMAHGVPFGEENIFYSDWEVSPVTEEFEKRFKSGAKLSDAYICANDQLAETVSYAMTDCGYEPDAAIITGFDFQQEGQNFYPSLASVDQCYDIVGERSAELLYHIFRGEAVEEELLVDCVFHPGESCGCLDSRSDDVHRRTVARGIPRHFSMNEFVDQRFQSMEREIVQAADYDDMKERLTRLFRSPGLEGDTFYIMMDPHVVDFSLGGISDHPQYQYADLMDTIVAKRDGNLISAGVIPTALLLPDADATDSVNHLYFFVPIYFESYVCGYIVMTDRPDCFASGISTYARAGSTARSSPTVATCS